MHGTLKTDEQLYAIFVFYIRVKLISKGAKVTEFCKF